jgi:hypothetical protein
MIIICRHSHEPKEIFNRVSFEPIQSDCWKFLQRHAKEQNCVKISGKINPFGEELSAWDRIGVRVCDTESISTNRE